MTDDELLVCPHCGGNYFREWQLCSTSQDFTVDLDGNEDYTSSEYGDVERVDEWWCTDCDHVWPTRETAVTLAKGQRHYTMEEFIAELITPQEWDRRQSHAVAEATLTG